MAAIVIGLENWKAWVDEGYTMLPFVSKHPLPNGRIMSWERAWEQASPSSIVLESGKDGRYTFLGLEPEQVVSGKEMSATLTGKAGIPEETLTGAPLDVLKRWMGRFRTPTVMGLPKFIGGCAGYLSYDVVRSLEKLPITALDDLGIPDYLLMRFDRLWILDHQEQELYCAVHTPTGPVTNPVELAQSYDKAASDASAMKRWWDSFVQQAASDTYRQELFTRELQALQLQVDVTAITGVQPAFEREAYMDAVRRIQAYIRDGDVFQVNLSVRQSKPLACSPEQLYEWLRLVNPSPYMGLLRAPEFQIVSGSPELLVQLEGYRMRTRPIAGTRPRGATPEQDQEMAEELLANEKERAEHIMLVDLERNDLGRVSRYGSVQVKDLLTIERYSHVMHLVSEVTGELATGLDAFDVIAATFPGGTITGAPKVRTMEIIEELEPVRRGPYTGSIGWIDYNGNMEFNIVIRTLVAKDGIGYVQAGAGIVIDSDPAKEYVESVNKAKAMWKAIQFAEQYPVPARSEA